ncbi:MAG: hypothetical protein MJZ26_09245 [Fibrobacter sp.]|nr:hypothetical protein [Fibrobacter sp.]
MNGIIQQLKSDIESLKKAERQIREDKTTMRKKLAQEIQKEYERIHGIKPGDKIIRNDRPWKPVFYKGFEERQGYIWVIFAWPKKDGTESKKTFIDIYTENDNITKIEEDRK